MKKLRIGWFTFTCCEDSTIMFTELLNTHWEEWNPKLEFVHAKTLQAHNEMREMDVAFVEGAIASEAQVAKLQQIRGLAKKLVAIGACAVVGMPSAQRNNFDDTTKAEIAPFLLQFHHADKIRTISDIVPVDDRVPGCPMNEALFLQVLNKYLMEFNISEAS